MLDIRQALLTALGSSFNVTHAGPQGNITVTVNVIDAGRGDEAAFPCVVGISSVGVGNPANMGGGGVRNDAFADFSIETLDADDINGRVLVGEIHSHVESAVRTVEKTLGGSYHSLISTWRDAPPEMKRGFHIYRRALTVRGANYEAY